MSLQVRYPFDSKSSTFKHIYERVEYSYIKEDLDLLFEWPAFEGSSTPQELIDVKIVFCSFARESWVEKLFNNKFVLIAKEWEDIAQLIKVETPFLYFFKE